MSQISTTLYSIMVYGIFSIFSCRAMQLAEIKIGLEHPQYIKNSTALPVLILNREQADHFSVMEYMISSWADLSTVQKATVSRNRDKTHDSLNTTSTGLAAITQAIFKKVYAATFGLLFSERSIRDDKTQSTLEKEQEIFCIPFNDMHDNIKELTNLTVALPNFSRACSFIPELFNADCFVHDIWTQHRPTKEDVAIALHIAHKFDLKHESAKKHIAKLAYGTGLTQCILQVCTNNIQACTNNVQARKRNNIPFDFLNDLYIYGDQEVRKEVDEAIYTTMLYSSREWEGVNFNSPETVLKWIRTPEYRLFDWRYKQKEEQEPSGLIKEVSIGRLCIPNYDTYSDQERIEMVNTYFQGRYRLLEDLSSFKTASIHDAYCLESRLIDSSLSRTMCHTLAYTHLPLLAKLYKQKIWKNINISDFCNRDTKLRDIDLKSFGDFGEGNLSHPIYLKKSSCTFSKKELEKKYIIKTEGCYNETYELALYHPNHRIKNILSNMYSIGKSLVIGLGITVGITAVVVLGSRYLFNKLEQEKTTYVQTQYNLLSAHDKLGFDYCLQNMQKWYGNLSEIWPSPTIPVLDAPNLSADTITRYQNAILSTETSLPFWCCEVGQFILIAAIVAPLVLGCIATGFYIKTELGDKSWDDKPCCVLLIKAAQYKEND